MMNTLEDEYLQCNNDSIVVSYYNEANDEHDWHAKQ